MNDLQLLRSGIAAEVRIKRDKARAEVEMWQHQGGQEQRVATEQGRVAAFTEVLQILDPS